MEFYLIDAITKSIVRAQSGSRLVGLKAPADRLLGAYEPAEVRDGWRSPPRALPPQGFGQDQVSFEKIVID